MNGAESLVHTLLKNGIDTCIANPGTSEMHFVAALDRIPGMHCTLGLHETVVTGMADGYYRIAERPACTLLHCGPGLANGLANLHNARRAGSGIVNIVGDQATHHRPLDAPLTADTEALARTMSAWVRTTTQSHDVGRDAAAAVQAARRPPGQIATLILPSDASWNEPAQIGDVLTVPGRASPDPFALETAARILRSGGKTLLLLAGDGVTVAAQVAAWRVAQATGADLLADYTNARVPRGRGRLPLLRTPYAMDAACKVLAPYDHILLVGAKAPVGFFAYPGKPSIQYRANAQVHVLTRPDQDAVSALRDLADRLEAPVFAMPAAADRPLPVSGPPTPEGFARTLAALMPEGAIVSDESLTFGRGFYENTAHAPPHDWLHLTGGAIGDGMPVAAGAALGAGRARRVINLQADGSALYSLQSLWTQARERLPVTTVIFNNRKYNILVGEYRNVGASAGPTAMQMLDLSDPDIDFVKAAESLGVAAKRAESLELCADLLKASFSSPDPFLIELMI